MRYFLSLLFTLCLMSGSASAQDSLPADGFLGDIGPSTEEERKNAKGLVLEMPKPPAPTHFGENGEVVLIQYGKDEMRISGTQNRFIDGRVYTENEAIEILELHYQRHQPPLQYAIHRNVESRSVMRFHKLLKTITPDVSLFILREP